MIFKLAHDLPLEAQELAAHGVSCNAVIHQLEGQNDLRNWHAHIVYAPFTLEREVDADGTDTGRLTFEDGDRLPPMPTRRRELDGNGPQGRKGASVLVQCERTVFADIQNTELRRIGADKRHDPRSHRDMGGNKVTGQHIGPKRAAIDGSGRAVDQWREECPEWRQVMAEIESTLEHWSAAEHEREGAFEAIEVVRLEMGAHAPEAAPERCAWGLARQPRPRARAARGRELERGVPQP